MWFLICFQSQHYTRPQSICARMGRLSGHLRLLAIILCLLSDLCFWEMCTCKASEKVQNVNLWPLLLTSTWWTRYLFPAVLFNIPHPFPISKKERNLTPCSSTSMPGTAFLLLRSTDAGLDAAPCLLGWLPSFFDDSSACFFLSSSSLVICSKCNILNNWPTLSLSNRHGCRKFKYYSIYNIFIKMSFYTDHSLSRTY